MAHAVDLTDLSRHPLEMQGFAVGTGRTADRRHREECPRGPRQASQGLSPLR